MFSPIQPVKFFPLLDHVTEMTRYLFKSIQFDFEEGNFRSGSGIKLLLSFAIAMKAPPCVFEINKRRPLYVL